MKEIFEGIVNIILSGFVVIYEKFENLFKHKK